MNAKLLDAIPVTSLTGVGAKMAEKLEKIGITSIQSLLFHLPFRYEDRTKITPIASLSAGQYTSVEGEIMANNTIFGRRPILTVKIKDTSGSLTLRFFNFNAAMKNSFVNGKKIQAYGEVKRGRNGYEIIHPEYKIFTHISELALEETLTPIYPTTDGLKQISLRNFTDQALALLEKTTISELLPNDLYDHQISLAQALKILHRPTPDISLNQLELGQHPAQKRLIIEELLAHNLSMLAIREKTQQHKSRQLQTKGFLQQALLQSLPFSPTNAQNKVVMEIQKDLNHPFPMMRLVQGDVGSGKTLVAALASLTVLEHNLQVALMAPTELLAEQHAISFKQWFEPLGIKVTWLAGKVKGKAREKVLDSIACGEAQMIIGTHALFQEDVIFNKLTLIIIDEQHRFGVHQRLSLREKGKEDGFYPHQLIMTATPIPRTLAMTAYADLDVSIIDELPPGRTPIKTVVIPDSRRDEIVIHLKRACLEEHRQAYWVCTLIDESEVLEAQAAEETKTDLSLALPELKIGLVHGRMKPAEKQEIMHSFKEGELNLLVATTVIEVGVDVPNASLIIIENPERLGLAQLHQLRGRVGRGSVASHCVLLYHSPLSKTAQKRLDVLRQSNDGFVIAQRDLEIRGPGEVLGTKQTGSVEFKITDLLRDQDLIPEAQHLAYYIHSHYPANAQAIIKRWLPNRDIYTNA